MSETNVNPLTGQPENEDSQTNFNAETMSDMNGIIADGAPDSGNGKKFKWQIPVIAGVAIAVAAVGIVYAAPRIMYGRNYKIVRAAKNTFKDFGPLSDVFINTEKLAGKQYTAHCDFKTDDSSPVVVKVKSDIGVDSAAAKAQLSLNVSAGEDISLSLKGIEADNVVSLSSPDILDGAVYKYDYSEKADTSGYLGDSMKEQNVSLKDINSYLRSLTSYKDQEAYKNELIDATYDFLNDPDFKPSSAKKVEVNGRECSCKGYEATLTSDNFKGWLERYKEIYKKYYDTSAMDKLMGSKYSFDESFDKLEDEAEKADDVKLDFYLADGRIADIKVSSDKDMNAELEINGGDYIWENYTLSGNDVTLVQKKSSMSGDLEKSKYSLEEKYNVSLEYDKKSGDISVKTDNSYVDLEGSLKGKDDGGFAFDIDRLKIDGSNIGSGSVSFAAGAEIAKKAGTGKTYELNSMSVDDFSNLASGLSQDKYIQNIITELSGLEGLAGSELGSY